jgi:hypothetical protein
MREMREMRGMREKIPPFPFIALPSALYILLNP